MTHSSSQKRIQRDRPPRVQIVYDVDVGEGGESKELPFVLGVVGDYSGHPREPLPRLKDRRFIQIDRDSFDEVLHGLAPRLELKVADRLRGEGGECAVELQFNRMEDFEPAAIARQVAGCRRLLELRSRLADLRDQLVGNDRLEAFMEALMQDAGRRQALGLIEGPDPAGTGAEEEA